MTREQYRKAVDAVAFDPGFVPRTLARLEARRKETPPVKTPSWKTMLIAAALVAALAATASAALFLLSPAQVAQEAGDPALAAAFASAEAVQVDETRTVGDYQVTFMGLVSGAHLTQHGAEQDRTYAVLACARADGQAITDNVPPVTATPLVEGYAPWEVNAWTLGGGVVSFAQDGVLYCLLGCDTPQPKAGGQVYLAVYPGEHMSPDGQTFSYDPATGAIALRPGQEGTLFPLPVQ